MRNTLSGVPAPPHTGAMSSAANARSPAKTPPFPTSITSAQLSPRHRRLVELAVAVVVLPVAERLLLLVAGQHGGIGIGPPVPALADLDPPRADAVQLAGGRGGQLLVDERVAVVVLAVAARLGRLVPGQPGRIGLAQPSTPLQTFTCPRRRRRPRPRRGGQLLVDERVAVVVLPSQVASVAS